MFSSHWSSIIDPTVTSLGLLCYPPIVYAGCYNLWLLRRVRAAGVLVPGSLSDGLLSWLCCEIKRAHSSYRCVSNQFEQQRPVMQWKERELVPWCWKWRDMYLLNELVWYLLANIWHFNCVGEGERVLLTVSWRAMHRADIESNRGSQATNVGGVASLASSPVTKTRWLPFD